MCGRREQVQGRCRWCRGGDGDGRCAFEGGEIIIVVIAVAMLRRGLGPPERSGKVNVRVASRGGGDGRDAAASSTGGNCARPTKGYPEQVIVIISMGGCRLAGRRLSSGSGSGGTGRFPCGRLLLRTVRHRLGQLARLQKPLQALQLR